MESLNKILVYEAEQDWLCTYIAFWCFSLPFFPWNCNNTFLFYCWHSCSYQYKSIQCCHVNTTVGFFCGVVELQNILFCCKNNKYEICIYVSVVLVICNENHIFFSAVSCCHLWPVWLCYIFPHYLINDTIFGQYLLNVQLLWFSLQFLSETFRRIQWDVINLHRTSHKVSIILVRFEWNLHFSTYCQKMLNIKFHENSSSGSWVVHVDRQTDGPTDTMKQMVTFHHFANT